MVLQIEKEGRQTGGFVITESAAIRAERTECKIAEPGIVVVEAAHRCSESGEGILLIFSQKLSRQVVYTEGLVVVEGSVEQPVLVLLLSAYGHGLRCRPSG